MKSFLFLLPLLFTGASAFADDIDVTCHVLGRINECQNVSICRLQAAPTGTCLANNPSSDRDRIVCLYYKDQNGCENVSSVCHWPNAADATPICVPSGR